MRTVPLGELAKPKQWGVLSKLQMVQSGHPVYGANGIIGYYTDYNHEAPTLLVGCRGTIGAIHISQPRAFVTSNTMALDNLDTSRILLQYLARFLAWRGLADVTSGSSQPQLTRENLVRVEVPLVPLLEQRRIAEILDHADALRTKRRQVLVRLDALTESIFSDTLSSRDPRVPLGDALTFVTSGGRGWAKYYSRVGDRFIQSLDVQMGTISDREPVFVTAPVNAEARRTRTQSGDVLLTITGSRIGRVSALPGELSGSYVSQHVAILRADPMWFRPEYLATMLGLPELGQRLIARTQYGQTKPGLNFEQIRGFELPRPSLERQDIFLARKSQVEGIRGQVLAADARAKTLFASLQDRAFRGEP